MFLIVILALIFISTTIIAANYNELEELNYRTLRGELYDIGTGEVSLLVFKTESGNYLVHSKDKLKTLKSLPLLLTGEVTQLSNNFFEGKIDVRDFNTYYESDWDEVSVLGRLVKGKNNLVLLTKNQIVIELDCSPAHSLNDHIEEEVIITGSFEEINYYNAFMEVKSYRVIR